MRACDNCGAQPAAPMIVIHYWTATGECPKPVEDINSWPSADPGDLCSTCIQWVEDHDWNALDQASQSCLDSEG